MKREDDKGRQDGVWLKAFCPNARCLSEEEVLSLPPETRNKVKEGEEDKGLWLEVFCPNEACLTEEEKRVPLVKVVKKHKGKGFWLNLFCPDEQCVLKEPTDLS